MKTFRERLGKEWLFFDGGTGSVLQKMGLRGGELPETWNLEPMCSTRTPSVPTGFIIPTM